MRKGSGRDGEEQATDPRLTKRYSKVLMIDGHPWFFRMTGDRQDTGLLGYYGQETASQGMLIAADAQGMMKLSKRFALFSSIDDFYRSVLQHPADFFNGEHFYEVVGATTPEQKPYFDIDIDPTQFPAEVDAKSFAEKIVTLIISTVREEIAKLIIDTMKTAYVFPVTVYSTAYPIKQETGLPKKFSYHLVFQGVHFAGHEDMRRFGTSVKEQLQELAESSGEQIAALASDSIDVIWFKTRQFRLLGSSKLGSDAVKVKVHLRTFDPEAISLDSSTYLQTLRESCVSVIPPGSHLLTLPPLPEIEETEAAGASSPMKLRVIRSGGSVLISHANTSSDEDRRED